MHDTFGFGDLIWAEVLVTKLCLSPNKSRIIFMDQEAICIELRAIFFFFFFGFCCSCRQSQISLLSVYSRLPHLGILGPLVWSSSQLVYFPVFWKSGFVS